MTRPVPACTDPDTGGTSPLRPVAAALCRCRGCGNGAPAHRDVPSCGRLMSNGAPVTAQDSLIVDEGHPPDRSSIPCSLHHRAGGPRRRTRSRAWSGGSKGHHVASRHGDASRVRRPRRRDAVAELGAGDVTSGMPFADGSVSLGIYPAGSTAAQMTTSMVDRASPATLRVRRGHGLRAPRRLPRLPPSPLQACGRSSSAPRASGRAGTDHPAAAQLASPRRGSRVDRCATPWAPPLVSPPATSPPIPKRSASAMTPPRRASPTIGPTVKALSPSGPLRADRAVASLGESGLTILSVANSPTAARRALGTDWAAGHRWRRG